MSKSKNLGLTRRASGLMALEQRFMFDGAAVADALQVVDAVIETSRESDAATAKLFDLLAPAAPVALAQAQADAQKMVVDFLARPEAKQQLFAIFDCGRQDAVPSDQWSSAYDAMVVAIQSGEISLPVELLSASQMQGIAGAFADQGLSGKQVIYLNADWVAKEANSQTIGLVLIEELGHAMDTWLNPGQDSTGDEGHAFASLVVNPAGNAVTAGSEDDRLALQVNGQTVWGEASVPYAISQTHYVPLAEANIQTALKAINTQVTGNIQTVIAITATSNGTVVVYDQWEDGYETSISNPTQATTRVWTYNNGWFVDTSRDGIQNNTEAAVSGTGIRVTGQSIILSNAVNPTTPATVDFDGRDKVGSTKAISVTRAGWSSTPGTVLAGAVNVIDSGNAGKVYTLPVGQNIETVAVGTNKLFEYTSAHIMATQDNTVVNIDKDGNGSTDITVILNEGQSYFVNGGLNAGAKVTADKGVGVYLIAGDVASSYENRWFALTADEQWASSYYAPVGTTLTANPAYVVIYNPEGANIQYETAFGSGTIATTGSSGTTWASNSTTKSSYFLMPASAARFFTTDTVSPGGALKRFYAVSVIDADAIDNATHDWSYSLVPESYLTDKFVVAWGPGADNVTRTLASGDLNASPVWLTPVNNAWIYVDSTTVQLRDGAGNLISGTVTAATANDPARTRFAVNKLQSYRLFDTSDKDQTGLTVYTLDGTLLTAAWGEDPSIAGPGTPYLDMGTTVTPFPDYVLSKESVENNPADTNTTVELGEEVKYTVRLTNRAVIDLFNVVLKDAVTPTDSATYVQDSMVLTVFRPDGTRAWKIEGGLQTIYAGDGTGIDGTTANTSLTGTPSLFTSVGYSISDFDPRTAGTNDGLQRGAAVEITYRVTVRSSINKALSDSDYTITNSVNMTGTGVSKSKENVIPLNVNVTDGEVFFMRSDFSATAASFESGNTLGLRVVDGDQNKNAAAAETVTVTVAKTNSSETESVTLTETGANTGIFQNTLLTNGTDTTNNNGTLKLLSGETIQVTYSDPTSGQTGSALGIDNAINWGITPTTYTSGTNTNLKTAVGVAAPPPTPTDGRVDFFNSTFDSTRVNFTEGSTLGIRVTDADQASRTSLQVTVINTTTNEREVVTLTRTDSVNGVFQGTLLTTTLATDAANNSGKLRTALGHVLQVDYTDPVTGTSTDNPTTPGTLPNRDTATVTFIKSLYLSADAVSGDRTGDLDRHAPGDASHSDTDTDRTAAIVVSASTSSSEESFSSAALNGGTGWIGSWIESDSTQDATSDNVRILPNITTTGNFALQLNGGGSSGSPRSLTREFAALTAASSIDFDYQLRGLDSGDTGLRVEYSANGSSWVLAGTVKGFRNSGGTESDFTSYPSNSAISGNQNGVVAVSQSTLPVGTRFIRFTLASSRNSDDVYIDNISISPASGGVAAPGTFTQAIPMATAIGLPASGLVNVTTFVRAETGLTSGTYAGITAALTYSASGSEVTIASLGSATYSETTSTSGVGTLTWSGELSSGLTIPKGASVKLVITNNVASSSFQIDYDSSTTPSRIDLPVTNVIQVVDVDGVDSDNDGVTENNGVVAGVQEIGFFDRPFSVGGNQISTGSIDAGGTVYLRVKVMDPFGAYDITSLKLSIDGPGVTGDLGMVTPVSASVVGSPAAGDTYKIFEYVWQTLNQIGEYTITATAAEGYENTISDVATGSFIVTARDLGTPSITQFITSAGADAGANYSAGAPAHLRVTDLDEASSVAGKTVTATVNGATVTLTQTGANTGVFQAALPSPFNSLAAGAVLLASYTDPNDGSDSSNDDIRVPATVANNAPVARPNAYTANESTPIAGNSITNPDADTDPDGHALTVIGIGGQGVAATGNTLLTLASGATVSINAAGAFTFNANGAFDYLNQGESATQTVSYTISDGNGGTSTSDLTFTITGVTLLPTVAIEVSPAGISEGDGSETTAMIFRVNLIGDALPTASSVTIRLSGAANPSDYLLKDAAGALISPNGSGDFVLSIAAGQISSFFTVDPVGDTVFEGAETVVATITAATTNTSVALTVTTSIASGTIYDDGSLLIPGDATSGAYDDDRTLSVVGGVVFNEASPYATFTVTGVVGYAVNLALGNDSDASTANATISGFSFEYSTNGGTSWTTYSWNGSGGDRPTVPVSGTILVRVNIASEQDSPFEGAETFTLTASYATNSATTSTAADTITDDGTGRMDRNGDGDITDANEGTGPGAGFDDDRAITVSGLDDVSEGSNAVFKIELEAAKNGPTEISLVLSNERATDNDYSTAITAYYLNNGSVVDLPVVNGKIMLPAGITSFFVRVPTVSDSNFEGPEDFRLTATVTGGKSGSDTSTILDDGNGRIYDLLGANPSGPGDDDGLKPAALPPTPPAPSVPAAPPAALVAPLPVVVPAQSFASALTPLAQTLGRADPPMSMPDAVTSGSGYQIPVSETAPVGLNLFQGVTDQFIQSTNVTTRISLPFDAFIHSSKDAVIRLQAKQSDDSNLPSWVQFEPATGVFIVTPPAGFKGKLDLKVLARDDDGREAVAMFQMFIGEQTAPQAQSRDSFSEKLKMAGKRQITLVRVADGAHKAPVREAAPAREAAAVRESAPVRVRAG
ncbi:Ig-like domain-containing protein [Limnohabitans sp. Rim8]|uniref:Ig-like domain-containing protein n=1 Tax=Limnohabitans sp. Rim8 TaxID=1100718 RepID=UPI0026315A7B|nr:Ig-like domain-containing protein [Limnohabitans sp. Rim8]